MSGDGTDDGKVEFVDAGDGKAEDMSLMSMVILIF